MKFRPTYGATEYCPGNTTNLSAEGLCIEARDFRFIKYEYLELLFPIPDGPLTLYGDVAWKQQAGRGSTAGITIRMKDRARQKQALEMLCASANVPLSSLNSRDDRAGEAEETLMHSAQVAGADISAFPNKLGIIKQYHDGQARCTVTFRIPREVAGAARNAAVAGDFNNWEPARSPMVRLESGDFVISIELDSRREYRFRYLIDGTRWENDWYADKYLRNVFGSKDSVVIV